VGATALRLGTLSLVVEPGVTALQLVCGNCLASVAADLAKAADVKNSPSA
jgi:hypothetical protein